jgi:hypothetical protein
MCRHLCRLEKLWGRQRTYGSQVRIRSYCGQFEGPTGSERYGSIGTLVYTKTHMTQATECLSDLFRVEMDLIHQTLALFSLKYHITTTFPHPNYTLIWCTQQQRCVLWHTQQDTSKHQTSEGWIAWVIRTFLATSAPGDYKISVTDSNAFVNNAKNGAPRCWHMQCT